MKTASKPDQSYPALPGLLSLPLKMIPAFAHSRLLVSTLNVIFNNDLKEGELDFLREKIVRIYITDADIEYRFTLIDEKFSPVRKQHPADLVLEGTIYDYLLLASRREDADTLFFSRRLHMQGDIELGLYVKNFLDGIDMDSHKMPRLIESLLQKCLPIYKKLFS